MLKNDVPKPSDSHRGKIARYAQGKNYHDVIKRRLHKLADQLRIDYPGSEFRTCVDTAPVNERELAALAVQNLNKNGGQVTLVWSSVEGGHYTVEETGNLTTWTNAVTNVPMAVTRAASANASWKTKNARKATPVVP